MECMSPLPQQHRERSRCPVQSSFTPYVRLGVGERHRAAMGPAAAGQVLPTVYRSQWTRVCLRLASGARLARHRLEG